MRALILFVLISACGVTFSIRVDPEDCRTTPRPPEGLLCDRINEEFSSCVPLCQLSCQKRDVGDSTCATSCDPNLHCVCVEGTVRAYAPDGPCIPSEFCCPDEWTP